MKKNEMSNLRGLRAGGYSIVLSLIVIAAVVVLNLLVAKLPSDITKPETAGIKLYDFDDQTRRIAESVDESVTIYVWKEKVAADETLAEFLTRYAALNSKIEVKYIDPALYPTFMEKYVESADDEPSANSLVVESGKRFRVVDYGEIYTYSYSTEELQYYYYYYGTLPSPDQFDAENAISSAIDYVTTDVLPTIYQLTGHGETSLGANMLAQLDAENFDVESLTLLTAETVPLDCDLLIIGAPTQDLHDSELEKILSYIENGGDVLLFTQYSVTGLENFNKLCASYGMYAEEGMICEETQAINYPYYLIANLELHTITSPLIAANSYVIAPFAHGILELADHRSTVTVEPLLTTTDKSYVKTLEFLANPPEGATFDAIESDAKGPFMIAATASENYNGNTGSLTWVSVAAFISDDITSLYGNLDFVMNTIANFCDKESTISVRSVDLGIEPLVVSESEANLWSIIMMLGVPAATVLVGFVVWFRRRKR
ncbi:MAG: GldG family protein [Clostridia bacterium]|nr:GldG family protein [Clostridia bacterium]